MYSDDFSVRVKNLSKSYEIYSAPRDRLKQFAMSLIGRLSGRPVRKYFKKFHALKDISFEIKRGETVGIIGRNGSGKSTLLQIICGTLSPSEGEVLVNGRVAALLELGSGFNPEFTGRENIYLNGAVHGLSYSQLNSRFNEILTFSEIGEFIDQPVKTYSSGMMVRLAFSVIAHIDADILIIDEALAVGDVFFQQKCMAYLRAFQDEGNTVIFVSHDTSAVLGLCSKALLLTSEAGEYYFRSAKEACAQYIEGLYEGRTSDDALGNPGLQEKQGEKFEEIAGIEFDSRVTYGSVPIENTIRISPFIAQGTSFGELGAKILDAWIEDQFGKRVTEIQGGETINLCIFVGANKDIQYPAYGFILKDRLGQYLIAEGTDIAFRNKSINLIKNGIAKISFKFVMPMLIMGEYTLDLAVAEGIGHDHIQHHWMRDVMVLTSLNSRLVHGILGLQNLQISIENSTI